MQITRQNQQYPTKTSFKGLRSKDARALFALDLDGTLAHGTNTDVQRVFQLAKENNAIVSYATGRSKVEFLRLQEKCQSKGVHLPTPEHMVANNGQFVYQNINGELIEDMKWRDIIASKTGFDRKTVFQTMHQIAHRPEYKHSQAEVETLKSFKDEKLKGFELRQKEDPLFWDSKISYYEWNPSIHFVEYFVGHDVHIPGLKKEIKAALSAQGIKNKFIYHEYEKSIMDECNDSILRKSRPLREKKDGTMHALFICPADKADGVKYLGQKLDIPNEEILTAGNDSNDWSLASFAKKGSFFVCVGNATSLLLGHIKKIKTDTIILPKNEGAIGIAEGIEQVLARFRPDLKS